MLELQHGQFGKNCSGFSRRSALKAGFLGALGLSSADLMRLRAEGKAARNNKSVILIWLDGGPSHMETYDPKPKAPKEYRGPWGDMATNVPGIRFSEMLPLQAKHLFFFYYDLLARTEAMAAMPEGSALPTSYRTSWRRPLWRARSVRRRRRSATRSPRSRSIRTASRSSPQRPGSPGSTTPRRRTPTRPRRLWRRIRVRSGSSGVSSKVSTSRASSPSVGRR